MIIDMPGVLGWKHMSDSLFWLHNKFMVTIASTQVAEGGHMRNEDEERRKWVSAHGVAIAAQQVLS